jgi:hypothetical protein
MSAQKICPSCNTAINPTEKKCPNCKKALELTYWEIELDTGEKTLYVGDEAEANIREHLVSGKLKLVNRCRQYTTALEKVVDGNDQYINKTELEWKSLRDYTDRVFALQVLYDPIKAYGKQAAQTTWIIIGVIVAVGWNADPFLATGANLIVAIIISIVLLLLTPTVIGLIIAAYIAAAIFGLPATGIAFRSFISILIGMLAGGAVGWTIGNLIGVIIGSTKKKALEG